MNINISVRLPDDTVFHATAMSFERAAEELAAIERKIAKLTTDNTTDVPF